MAEREHPKDPRPEGSMILKATYIAELARAQQYAVEAVAAGYFASADLVQIRTKYFPFPAYTIITNKAGEPSGREHKN